MSERDSLPAPLGEWLSSKELAALAGIHQRKASEACKCCHEVNRNHIEDDQLGIYVPQAQMAGFSASQLPDEIVADLKNNAFTSLCYDGQYFYDTDHPVAGANVSNKLAVALSASTLAAAAASYGAARTAILSFKDDEGRALALIPDVLEVPPALESVALTLINSDKLVDNSPNPYKGTARVVVNSPSPRCITFCSCR